MKQHELDLAIAKATGESVETIKRMGFSMANECVVRSRCDIEAAERSGALDVGDQEYVPLASGLRSEVAKPVGALEQFTLWSSHHGQ